MVGALALWLSHCTDPQEILEKRIPQRSSFRQAKKGIRKRKGMKQKEQDSWSAQWGEEVLAKGYTRIPNVFLRHYRQMGLEHGEFGFLCLLLSYKHGKGDPFPKQATLAQAMGVSVKQIRKWMQSVEAKGFLWVEHAKGTNRYHLKPLFAKVKAFERNQEQEVPQKGNPRCSSEGEQEVPARKEERQNHNENEGKKEASLLASFLAYCQQHLSAFEAMVWTYGLQVRRCEKTQKLIVQVPSHQAKVWWHEEGNAILKAFTKNEKPTILVSSSSIA